MIPVSHGYHVVENKSLRGSSDERELDSVVVQREIDELELWFFGVLIRGLAMELPSLFSLISLIRSLNRKTKETMKKAYLGARAKAIEAQKEDETVRAGSASVMVINGEKLVMANLGGYRAVVCRDGVAHQLSSKHHGGARRLWTRRLFPVRILVCDSSDAEAIRPQALRTCCWGRKARCRHRVHHHSKHRNLGGDEKSRSCESHQAFGRSKKQLSA
ncbi:putative protein phosphatase 2C-like protein 44-like isoform X2 [Hibiscus syriacus]|uniref:PPM-type phosphatase domain-containing protein n=1 Tax=Hibiscus syriacus TaxID=106335 RepID=A0A6A2XZB0_HIBSY|nr:putative protein phosphatase 2C-like protein 44-like isoform X2 [Hibiscus syriacus]